MSDQPHAQPRLDEQMIAQAVQLGLESQLETADEIHVEVQTELGKAVQGQADTVSMSGQGLVMQSLRVQELDVQTDRIAVNPLSVLLGKPALDQPLDATARVVLTEADLNRALNSDLVIRRIPALTIDEAGEAVTATLQFPLQVRLGQGEQIHLEGAAQLQKRSGTRSLHFTVGMRLCEGGLPLTIESFSCSPGQGVTLALAIGLLHQFQAILSQPYLEVEGIALQIQRVEVEEGALTLITKAHLEKIPAL